MMMDDDLLGGLYIRGDRGECGYDIMRVMMGTRYS